MKNVQIVLEMVFLILFTMVELVDHITQKKYVIGVEVVDLLILEKYFTRMKQTILGK